MHPRLSGRSASSLFCWLAALGLLGCESPKPAATAEVTAHVALLPR